MTLTGRVALVTGGNRGIGKGIALGLARDGADIAVNYRRDEAQASQTIAEIEKLGVRAIAYQAPVDDYEIYEQANGRITRPGQLCKQTIIHLICSGVEQKIYTRLKNKEKMQGILLELLNEK